MTCSLPSVGGRPPRVALLVYNDAHADSRVIKTAESLRAAGTQVRIFAVARARAGYPEGADTVGEGVPVWRAPEFELRRYAPWLLHGGRLLLRRRDPGGSRESTAAPVTAQSSVRAGTGARGRAVTVGSDLWLRTYRVVSLGLYWVLAARAAAEWIPDVVHANDGNTLSPAWWISRRTGARVVYDAHELWRHRNVRTDRPVAPLVERLIESLVIRRADGVITVSPSIALWLQDAYALPIRPSLVRNIPRGQIGALDPAVGRLRELASLGPETQVIAYGGRITTSRGIEETLEALALLPDRVHFVLLGYGEPDYLALLHARIARLGVADRVHLIGKVAPDLVATALADADLSVVYVRPICLSYRFSLPNKLFESIHAGLPIAAADLPDTAAIVRERGVGEIFDVDSPVDMAATIARLLADPQRYRDAAAVAARELTWQHEERELIGLYAEVLQG
ncbi:MAG: glycosyltransferase [Ornithinimicrobium sp.]|uniref:glycosyltransferase n=1 Tax=Ornithinimicrobium sp. TaxID=1977084 RepID=UPI003D9B63CD